MRRKTATWIGCLSLQMICCQPSWQLYESQEGGFTVLMPGTPEKLVLSDSGFPGFTRVDYTHATVFGEVDGGLSLRSLIPLLSRDVSERMGVYEVMYSDLDEDFNPPRGNAELLRIVRDSFVVSASRNMEGINSAVINETRDGACSVKVISERDVSLGMNAGIEIQFEWFCESNPDAALDQRHRFYLVGRRLYVLGVSGPKQVPIIEAISDDSDKFFDSFKLE